MGSFWRGGGTGKERAVRRVWEGLGRVGEGCPPDYIYTPPSPPRQYIIHNDRASAQAAVTGSSSSSSGSSSSLREFVLCQSPGGMETWAREGV